MFFFTPPDIPHHPMTHISSGTTIKADAKAIEGDVTLGIIISNAYTAASKELAQSTMFAQSTSLTYNSRDTYSQNIYISSQKKKIRLDICPYVLKEKKKEAAICGLITKFKRDPACLLAQYISSTLCLLIHELHDQGNEGGHVSIHEEVNAVYSIANSETLTNFEFLGHDDAVNLCKLVANSVNEMLGIYKMTDMTVVTADSDTLTAKLTYRDKENKENKEYEASIKLTDYPIVLIKMVSVVFTFWVLIATLRANNEKNPLWFRFDCFKSITRPLV